MIRVEPLLDAVPKRFLQRQAQTAERIERTVASIIEKVRVSGDAALRDLTKRLDGVELTTPWLSQEAWDASAAECPKDVQDALAANMARIEAFHERQVGAEDTFEVAPGITLGRRPIPYQRVACYVPGGRASYPSTVLMTVVPARLAGVQQIIVVTPPRNQGTIDPAVAYAAKIAGATAVFTAGGAQAVAALALGTETIPAVDAIVGPGNAYVTAAKVALQHTVRIDSPAGPSELLILADETADPAYVVADMVAQAEHDPEAQVILVTPDEELARNVAALLPEVAANASRKAVIEQSLTEQGAILHAKDWDAAIAFSDAYAPEHLEIMSKDPEADLVRIRNAGSIFLGAHAPVSIGDYGSGTNHVLPTMGHARLIGGLSVDHFRKWITWQNATADGLKAIAQDVIKVADAEGLHGHAEAVRRRLA